MKRLLLLLVVLSTVNCWASDSKDVTDSDGTDWQSYSEAQKVGYIAGYISAMSAARLNMSYFCSVTKDHSSTVQTCNNTVTFLDYSEITVGQYLRGMDELYKDFRNGQLPITYGLRLVRDEVKGRTQESVERELVAWRGCHADSSKCDALWKVYEGNTTTPSPVPASAH